MSAGGPRARSAEHSSSSHRTGASQYAGPVNLDARIALHRDFSTASEPWHAFVRRTLGDLSGRRVLEVGCGSGALWRTPGSTPSTLVLTDRSEGMVATACTVVPDATGVCADIERLPFTDASFDLVVANHCLYHLHDLYRGLAELRRLLRPGGTLVAATNGRDHMRELKEVAEPILGLPPIGSVVTSCDFALETALFPLHAFFPDVALVRHDDALRVTDVEPLVAWVVSLLDDETRRVVAPRVPQLRRELAGRMAASGGVFHVSKSSGVFVARVPLSSELRSRDAARVLLLDPEDRVLLLEGQAPDGRRFWLAPGGGLDAGEGHAAAARRELREELGIDIDPGRAVWRRTHAYRSGDHVTEQTERYFVVRADRVEVLPERLDDYVVGHRWWSLDEIRAATGVAFAPRRLAAFLAPILEGRLPTFPIDVGP